MCRLKNSIVACVVAIMACLSGCASHTNYVKDGGDFQADSLACNEQVGESLKSVEAEKPNELNIPKASQYTSPFESCMVSKGWHPEKTEFRLNALRMTW